MACDFENQSLRVEVESLRKSQLSASSLSVYECKDKRSLGMQTDQRNNMISIPVADKKREVKFDLGGVHTISQGAKQKLRSRYLINRKRAQKS